MEILDGGDNLSAGQSQLFSLARALLKRSRVMILDEATASVDVETDLKIQLLMQSLGRDTTVITIAHRLHTIINCDRILVMDAGRVAQFDTPSNLLKLTDGLFYQLWNAHIKSSAE